MADHVVKDQQDWCPNWQPEFHLADRHVQNQMVNHLLERPANEMKRYYVLKKKGNILLRLHFKLGKVQVKPWVQLQIIAMNFGRQTQNFGTQTQKLWLIDPKILAQKLFILADGPKILARKPKNFGWRTLNFWLTDPEEEYILTGNLVRELVQVQMLALF